MNVIPEIFYFIYLEENAVSRRNICFELLSASFCDSQESVRLSKLALEVAMFCETVAKYLYLLTV